MRGSPEDVRKRKRALFLAVVFTILAVVFAIAAFSAGGGSGDDDSDDQVRIVIDYSGSWSGAVGDLSGSHSVDGTGHASYILDRPENTMWSVSAVIQKSDDGAGTLTVSIVDMDGHVLKTSSTTAGFGVATVAVVVE